MAIHTKTARALIVLTLIVLGLMPPPAAAQDGGGACPALVVEAAQAAHEACAGMARNAACAGYEGVTFQPAATESLAELESLATSAADPDAGAWGVALLTVQANLPDEGGEAVTYVLFGDAEVTNIVDPELAAQGACTATPLNVEAVNVRSGPGLDFAAEGQLPPGTEALVTGRNQAGDWLQIQLEDGFGWVAEWVVSTTCTVPALPVVAEDQPGTVYTRPMQAIMFRSGTASPCPEAPNGLLIHSTADQPARIQVNGVALAVNGTAFLTAQPDGNLIINGLRGAVDVSAAGELITVRPSLQGTVALAGLEAAGPPTAPAAFTDIGPVPGLLRSVINGEAFDWDTAAEIFTGSDMVAASGTYAESITSVNQDNVANCSWYWDSEVIEVGFSYEDTATITIDEGGQTLTYAVEWGSGTLTLAGGLTYTGTIEANTPVSSAITLTFTSPSTYEIEILDTSTNAECPGGTQLWRGTGTAK